MVKHKGKVPTGQAAYDQYLDPSIQPPLSTPNDRKCPFDAAQCQMDGICFLNTQRALLGDERLPQASAIQAEARSGPRNNIATRIEFEFVETRPPSFPHPSNLPLPFFRQYMWNIFSMRIFRSKEDPRIKEGILLNKLFLKFSFTRSRQYFRIQSLFKV